MVLVISLSFSGIAGANEFKKHYLEYQLSMPKLKNEQEHLGVIRDLIKYINLNDPNDFKESMSEVADGSFGFDYRNHQFEIFQQEWRKNVLLPALESKNPQVIEASIYLYGAWLNRGNSSSSTLVGAGELLAFRNLPASSASWYIICTMLGSNPRPGYERSIFAFQGWPSEDSMKMVEAQKHLLETLIKVRNTGHEFAQVPAHKALRILFKEFKEKHAEALAKNEQHLAELTSIEGLETEYRNLDNWDARGNEAYQERLAERMYCDFALTNEKFEE